MNKSKKFPLINTIRESMQPPESKRRQPIEVVHGKA